MQAHKFEDGAYLCILGYDGVSVGDYEVYSCDNKQEVFKVLTKRIKDEIAFQCADGYSFFSRPDEIEAYVTMLQDSGTIQNPAIIKDCYETFFADCWWFKVIDSYGEVWFERER